MAVTGLFHLREHWSQLKRGRPGHRFQDRYRRAQRDTASHSPARRIAFYAAGAVMLVIGVLLVIFPGPAIPFFFLAGGLFATHSRRMARLMDWCEVRLRKIAAWGRARWRKLPVAVRVGLLILGGGLSAATMYFTYRLMHR